MNLFTSAISRSWLAAAGATLSVAIGCSSDPATPAGQLAAGNTGTVGAQPASMVPGAAGTTAGSGTASSWTAGTGSAVAGTTGAGGAGTAPKPPTGTGTGEFGGIAGTPATTTGAGGTPAMPPTAGSGTTTTPPATAACDTSTFMPLCVSGGQDNWGKPAQLGPCANGQTLYGVKREYGPYGVRYKYNLGQAFKTGGTADPVGCAAFIDAFGADPKGSADLKDTHDLDFGLYSVYYPGCMPEGEKFPLITWGNGTCAMPEGYGSLLRFVASHGYVVVAANSVQTGSGAEMRKAIDFMFAENKDSKSEFFGKIDEDKVGAMGHSQGGMGTIAAASDPRIKSVIIWNGGTSAPKPFLAVSGDRDIGGSPSGMKNSADAAPSPAAWLFYHQIPAAVDNSSTGQLAPGHLTLMMEPERVSDVARKWWDMMLKGDAEAKKMFVGPDCGICKGTELQSQWITGAEKGGKSHEYGANAMLK